MLRKKLIAASLMVAATIPSPAFAFSPPEAPPFDVDLGVHELIDIVLGVFWSLTVLLVIIYFVAIGLLFLTSRGDSEKLAQAQLALRVGFIGVVIILVAFSIVSIVRNTIGL